MPCHLAQLNIGHLVAPLDAPEIAGFVAALEEINALADARPRASSGASGPKRAMPRRSAHTPTTASS